MNKSQCIRYALTYCNDSIDHLTDGYLIAFIKQRFRKTVLKQHIHQIAGPYAKRLKTFGSEDKYDKAKELLNSCDNDYQLALAILDGVSYSTFTLED